METFTTMQVYDFSLEDEIAYDQNDSPFSDVKVLPVKGDYMRFRVYHNELEEFFYATDWCNYDLPQDYCDRFTAFIYEGPMDELIKEYMEIEIVE